MYRLNEEKGITLIALVITIVVLLILASVSMNVLLGDNGLITKTRDTVDLSKRETIIEDIKMEMTVNQIDDNGITELTLSEIKTLLGKYGTVEGDTVENMKVTLNDTVPDSQKISVVNGYKGEIFLKDIYTGAIKDDIIKISSPVTTLHTATEITYSWDELEEIAKLISNNSNITSNTSEIEITFNGETKKLGVGDTIKVNDKKVRILGFNHDVLTNEAAYGEVTATGKAGISFEYVDLIGSNQKMNSTETSEGGWGASNLRTKLNGTFYKGLPQEVKNKIKQVEKSYIGTHDSTTLSTSSDYLWLLSCAELWNSGFVGTDSRGLAIAAEGSQYKYYQQGDVKFNSNTDYTKKPSTSSPKAWWLRSPDYYTDNCFCIVADTGGCGAYYVNNTRSVCPGFCI